MYQTTFQHTIQYTASSGKVCKNLEEQLPWRHSLTSVEMFPIIYSNCV